MSLTGEDSGKQKESLEVVAQRIYGSVDSPAFKRWVTYWKASRERNEQLFRDFEKLLLLQLKGKRILDIGCGGGGTIRKLARIAAEGRVHGIDYSEESVRICTKTNRRLIEAGRVEIRHGSVSSLPLGTRLLLPRNAQPEPGAHRGC